VRCASPDLPRPLDLGPLAQLVERRSFKPCGSGFDPRAAHHTPPDPRRSRPWDGTQLLYLAAVAEAHEGEASGSDTGPADGAHDQVGAALDAIEADLDEVAATLARMG
jgi:hypothetical protein